MKDSATKLCYYRYSHKMNREYTWDVKNKATKGYEVREFLAYALQYIFLKTLLVERELFLHDS